MVPRKIVLFVTVVVLGAVLSVVHLSFLRDLTRRFSSRTIIHVHETALELNNKGDGVKDELDNSVESSQPPVSVPDSDHSSSDDGGLADKKLEIAVPPTVGGKPNDEEAEKAPRPQCPIGGSDLVGLLYVDQSLHSDTDIVNQLSVDRGGTVDPGGSWKPTECVARAKVAIIIPFRNRQKQLSMFLFHIHPILQRQLLDYRIFVIEQDGTTPFNRASLFNVGFKEALKYDSYTCFVFSDVDLLPEDDRNNYGCPSSPRHLSVAVDKFNYRLPYETIFGGVGSFTRKDFEEINGFSNMFWGWGGEDDDLYGRIRARGMKLTRPPLKIGRYTMIKVHHFQSHGGNPERNQLLHDTEQRMTRDGLNSLKYSVAKITELPLVTVITVSINKEDHM